MTATTLEMLGEVVAVARKRGLDPKPFLDIIDKHDVRRAGAQIYGEKIVRQALCAWIRHASGIQVRASGVSGSGKRWRADAVGRRRTRPDDHWNCARLRRH